MSSFLNLNKNIHILAFFLIFFLIGIFVFSDYGISIDEDKTRLNQNRDRNEVEKKQIERNKTDKTNKTWQSKTKLNKDIDNSKHKGLNKHYD